MIRLLAICLISKDVGKPWWQKCSFPHCVLILLCEIMIIYILCVWVFTWVCVCLGRPEEGIGSPELEIWIIVSYLVVAGNWTQIFCKSSHLTTELSLHPNFVQLCTPRYTLYAYQQIENNRTVIVKKYSMIHVRTGKESRDGGSGDLSELKSCLSRSRN